MLRWQPGRQGGGYRKLRLLEGRRFDLHLIDYPPGAGIPWHTDPIRGHNHLRVNVALLTGGSKLITDNAVFRLGERFVAFWSDHLHYVTPNTLRRVVLSLGLAL